MGEAAVLLGVPESILRKLVNSGVIDVPRVGPYRVFPGDRLDEYREALRRAGRLPGHERPRPVA